MTLTPYTPFMRTREPVSRNNLQAVQQGTKELGPWRSGSYTPFLPPSRVP